INSPPTLTMAAPKSVIKTAFDAVKTIQPIYTGGKVALDASGRILVTTLNEEVLITDFETGDELARIEGVGHESKDIDENCVDTVCARMKKWLRHLHVRLPTQISSRQVANNCIQ